MLGLSCPAGTVLERGKVPEGYWYALLSSDEFAALEALLAERMAVGSSEIPGDSISTSLETNFDAGPKLGSPFDPIEVGQVWRWEGLWASLPYQVCAVNTLGIHLCLLGDDPLRPRASLCVSSEALVAEWRRLPFRRDPEAT